ESILDTQCVLLLGQAGIGKTSLAAQLVERLKYEPQTLDIFIWRPFYSPTSLRELVPELLELLDISHSKEEDLIGQINQLIEALREHRILLVLDGVDRLLNGKDPQYPYGECGDYAWFIRTLSTEAHRSCILLTSREPLPEVAWLNETGQSARIIRLEGLGKDAKNILRVQGLADPNEWGTLIQIYRGNPLSLKMVASRINSFFNGRVSRFLQCKTTWMGEPLKQALDTQFRIGPWSNLERRLMQYLADDLQESEQAAFSQVYQSLKEKGMIQSMTELMEAIEILCSRSLLERNQSDDSEVMLSLQPVIKKYVLTDPSGIIQDTLAA
ncbi:MAG: NACHT domain-containing protein, partial [Acaryochloris sp. RU_4_1]|nr:NACHT domain-containing protein [Acaryochloris sp. RU_4_1]